MFAKLSFAVSIFVLGSWAQASNPQSFVYQGRLMESNGHATTGAVTLKLQIYNPAKTCLLYEESQSVDLTGTDGLFTVAVGSPAGNAKRTGNDPALAMNAIFSNRNVAVRTPGTNCSSGYTPANADVRYLRVTVTQGGTVDLLSPDQVLSAVPFATTAETLQGKQPGDFIQLRTDAGYSLNQANVESVFTSSNFAKLLGLLNGSGPTDLGGQRLTSVGTPSSGSDAVNKSYSDSRLAGAVIDSGGLSSGKVLSYNAVTQQWEPVDLPNSARIPAATCPVGEASRWDGSSWSCVSTGGGGGGTATISTDNTTTVLTSASPKIHMISLATAGAIKLPAANTYATTGGPIFQFLNTSGVDVPVLNASGKLVGRVPGGGGCDVFLFNNSSVDGQWATTAASIGTATTKIVTLASSPDTITGGFVTAARLSSSAHLLGYDHDAGGATDGRVRVAQVNEGTENVTLGTSTPLLAAIQPSSIRLFGFSASQALGVVVDNTSTVQLFPLSISGASVSVGSGVPAPVGCQAYAMRADQDASYCHDSSANTSRILPNGTIQTVNEPGFNDFYPLGTYSGTTLMGKCGVSGLEIKAVDFATPAILGTQLISGTANCNLEWMASGNGQYVYLPDGSGKTWVVFRISGTTYKVKVSWNGSAIVTDVAAAAIGMNYGATVLSLGGSNYLIAGSGTGTLTEITSAAAMTVSAPSLYSECYGPFISSPNRCINYQMQSPTSIGASFKITR